MSNERLRQGIELPKKNDTIMPKLYIIIIFVLLLNIPLFMVSDTIKDRAGFKIRATDDVAKRWAQSQVIYSPSIVLKDKKEQVFRPNVQNIDIDLKTRIEKKDIFEIPVYIAKIKISGDFNLPKQFDGILNIKVSDSRGFVDNPAVKINGNRLVTNSNMGIPIKCKNGINTYDIEYNIKGTKQILIDTKDVSTNLKMVSNDKKVEFIGNFSPIETNYTQGGFEGKWAISKIAAGAEIKDTIFNKVTDNKVSSKANLFGISYSKNVDNYRMTERAIKYGFLFICLTYLAFFVFEVDNKRFPIHPFQYSLIGISLVIFYLLLLSLSEFINFKISYIISAFMTILTIGGYTYFVLTKKENISFSLLISGILAFIYTYLFVIINLEKYALLFGSFGLFFAIITIMFATRNIQWYKQD